MKPHWSEELQHASLALIRLALAEDFGTTGDRTTLALVPADRQARAVIVARQPGVLAGLPLVPLIAEAVGGLTATSNGLEDGAILEPGSIIATLAGAEQSLLMAERTILNFLQRMSGVASLTRRFVQEIEGTNAKILDTRKTIPGWRLLDKYAVLAGGGVNHRLGLYDGILIKDNHLVGLGEPASALVRAVQLARAYPGNAGLPVEVEVDTLEQLEQVLPVQPEIVLLDNMTLDQMRRAVQLRDRLSQQTQLEASGGVNLQTVRAIAETGVDRISVGALTHSAPALDIALDELPR